MDLTPVFYAFIMNIKPDGTRKVPDSSQKGRNKLMNHHFFIKAASVLALCPMIFSSAAFANEAELMTLVKNMQKQMSELQSTVMAQKSEIEALKAGEGGKIQMAPAGVESAPAMSEEEFKQRLTDATGGADKWLKDLKFKGDLRLRYEAFQNTSGAVTENDDRNRFRYRLRFGWEKKFSDQMNIGFYLASGEGPTTSGTSAGSSALNSDPTSTNTSLDGNFNFKPIYIEKVFAAYNPEWTKIGPVENLNVTAGKFDNPFEKGSSDILWDRDVKPEGIYEKVDLKLLDTTNFDLKSYLTSGQFVLDEDANTSGGGDANLFAFQLGINPVFYTGLMERPVDLLSSVSYYSFGNYATGSNFMVGGVSLARGNPLIPGSTTQLAAGRFDLWEVYNEVAFYPYGIPVRPYFDWISNIGNKANNRYNVPGRTDSDAWAIGIKIGALKKKHDWEVGYAYKWIGDNAVPGFNDSDFGYNGHSGKRGSVIKAGYNLTDALTVNAGLYFVNNLNQGTGGILDQEQRRLQLDMNWKF
jgi:hypothetical protein